MRVAHQACLSVSLSDIETFLDEGVAMYQDSIKHISMQGINLVPTETFCSRQEPSYDIRDAFLP